MAKPTPLTTAPEIERARTLIASAVRTLETEAAGVTALSAAIHDGLGQAFVAAVELIRSVRGRLIVTGMGKSGHVGRKIAATFASTGTPAYFVHPSEASHGDLGMITADDVIMAISWSGETAELKDLTDYSRRFKIGLIAVTSNRDSTLAAAADIVLALPLAREACPHNLAPTTSTLMQQALGDSLAIALLESRGFTALKFAELHPGGKLGAMLKFVRDIMRAGDDVPLVKAGTRMADALVVMTAKSVGCVVIVNAGRPADRHHHRRRSTPAHERQSGRPAGRGDHDARAEDGAARSARQRGARDPQRLEEDPADRRRRRASRSASCTCTTCCAPAWLDRTSELSPLVPAKAGTQTNTARFWIPAYAGMSGGKSPPTNS